MVAPCVLCIMRSHIVRTCFVRTHIVRTCILHAQPIKKIPPIGGISGRFLVQTVVFSVWEVFSRFEPSSPILLWDEQSVRYIRSACMQAELT